MAPLGSIAGTAASFIGSYTTLLGALLGLVIGRFFNGTVIPLSVGYLGLGAACLGVILWTEKGRLSIRDLSDEATGERAVPVAAE
jgi:DHA1 family bicyclomycin/chloramphenicol resistance-like MFS transporter